MTIFKRSNISLLLKLLILLFLFSSCSLFKRNKIKKHKSIVINSQAPENNSIDSMIQPYKIELEQQMKEVLNTADVDLVKGKPESNMGNLMTDLSMNIASKYYQPKDQKEVDFCLLNNGGFRTSIAKGPITLGNVFEVMPFENELVVVTLSYDSCLALFDYVATHGEPFSHALLKIKANDELQIEINGQALAPGNSYKVVTSDYLARGGDNMVFFKNPIHYEMIGIKLRDAIIEYFINEKIEGRTITSKIDGRVSHE